MFTDRVMRVRLSYASYEKVGKYPVYFYVKKIKVFLKGQIGKLSIMEI